MDDDTEKAMDALKDHRASIDRLDAILVYTLAERFKHTKEIGKLKAGHDMPPSDKEREAYQVNQLRKLAQSSGLDEEFAQKFIRFIMQEVIRHHELHRNG